MPDYTSIEFWIHQLAAREMASLKEEKISCNHMALAACSLEEAVRLSPKGTPLEQRQANRVANAFAALGADPAALHQRVKRALPLGTTSQPEGRSVMISFGPGVGALSARAHALAKPNPLEGSHFLAATLESATPEIEAALKDLGIERERLIEALRTAPDTPPRSATPAKDATKLPVLARSKARRSVLTVANAKWKNVRVSGWRFEIGQSKSFAICLKQASSADAPTVSGFQSPQAEGGGLNLEIELDEPVEVRGDAGTLIVASRAAPAECSIVIEAVPNAAPPLAGSFTLADAARPVRLRLAAGGFGKLLALLGRAGKGMSVESGEAISLPAGARLTAVDAADVGVPMTLVVGEKNVGSVIDCDAKVRMWSYEGKGHPSLGVLIWVGLPAGTSLRLSKPSLVVVARAGEAAGKPMPLSPTFSVEKHKGAPLR